MEYQPLPGGLARDGLPLSLFSCFPESSPSAVTMAIATTATVMNAGAATSGESERRAERSRLPEDLR